MEKVFNPEYKHFEDRFDSILKDFETSGEQVGFGKRNAIRAFDAAGLKVIQWLYLLTEKSMKVIYSASLKQLKILLKTI